MRTKLAIVAMSLGFLLVQLDVSIVNVALASIGIAVHTSVTGLVLFLFASLGCALAPNTAMLLTMRALQGVGASALVPCSLSLLNHTCRDDATFGALMASDPSGMQHAFIAATILLVAAAAIAARFIGAPGSAMLGQMKPMEGSR